MLLNYAQSHTSAPFAWLPRFLLAALVTSACAYSATGAFWLRMKMADREISRPLLIEGRPASASLAH